MKRKIFLSLALGLLLAAFGGCSHNVPAETGDYKTIKDMDDNEVRIPVSPQKIACMHCVSPERIMILGAGGRISIMSRQSSWAYRLFPEIKNANTTQKFKPEEMVKTGIDLVLYTPGMSRGDNYRNAGLNTVCAFSAKKRPRNIDEFIENFERQFTLFGDVLGGEAVNRAAKYNAYFEKKVKQILAITSKTDRKNWPKVYYGGRGRSMLNTQGRASVMHWDTVVAGGEFLPARINDNYARATMEQIRSWDPDVVFLSAYCRSDEIVTGDPQWASVKAVRAGKVYRIPRGVFAWDHASGEGPLLMIYMAKIFHPDLFIDWDMKKEMKTFYSEVYGKKITDRDAGRILRGLPPL